MANTFISIPEGLAGLRSVFKSLRMKLQPPPASFDLAGHYHLRCTRLWRLRGRRPSGRDATDPLLAQSTFVRKPRARDRTPLCQPRLEGHRHHAHARNGRRAREHARRHRAAAGCDGPRTDRGGGHRRPSPSAASMCSSTTRATAWPGLSRARPTTSSRARSTRTSSACCRTTQAFVPHFREKGSGTVVTTTSIGGLVALPLNSVYHATKWGLEGWTESMSFELGPFGIRMKTVAPGGISTDFAGRSLVMTAHPAYDALVQKVMTVFRSPERRARHSTPAQIAEVVYEAATDGKDQVRYVRGRGCEGHVCAAACRGIRGVPAGYSHDVLRLRPPGGAPVA